MFKRAIIFILGLLFVCFTSVAYSADMQWDYPSDWDAIEGWTINFTDGSQDFNKTIYKTDVTGDGTYVTYTDIDNNLNLGFGVQYTFELVAFNDAGASDPSNSVTYTRSAYNPPADVLPPAPVGTSGSPSNVGVVE